LSWTNYPQTLNEPNGYNQQITKPQKICPGQKKNLAYFAVPSVPKKKRKKHSTPGRRKTPG